MKHVALVLSLVFVASPLFAHCDWLKGPVVLDAQAAIAAGEVGGVLKWVAEKDEKEIRDAFARTMKVRGQSTESRELADRWFFETLVRLHRQSEGEPYTGLRGDEYTPDPAIVLADQAYDSGSLEAVEKRLSEAVLHGVRERFRHARHAREHGGRESVHAYTEFVHYVLGLDQAAKGAAQHHE